MKPLFQWVLLDFFPMARSGAEVAASGVEPYNTARCNDRYLCTMTIPVINGSLPAYIFGGWVKRSVRLRTDLRTKNISCSSLASCVFRYGK